MGFKAALYLALVALTAVFYVSGTITNLAVRVGRTVSLWAVCANGICSGQYSTTCTSGNQILNADRAFTVMACSFTGMCLFLGVTEYVSPNKLYKHCIAIVCVLTLIFGTIAFSLGFAAFNQKFCADSDSLHDAGYEIGPHPILMLVGCFFNCCAIAVQCYGPETQAEVEERERLKQKAKRRGMAPPPSMVPKAINSNSNGAVSSIRPPPSSLGGSRSSSVMGGMNQGGGGGAVSSPARPIVIINKVGAQAAPPAPQVFARPEQGDWILDRESGLYWSHDEQLWFDDTTGFFIDPVTGQSYDPTTQRWSG